MLNPNPYMLLAATLGFSAADLNANRLGVLTPYQRQMLISQRSRLLGWSVGIMILLALVAVIFEVQLILIAFLAACFVTIIVAARQRFQEDLDVPVETIAGKVTLQPISFGRYNAVVNGQSFRLPRQFKSAFSQSLNYRLYYAPGTRTILSAEII
jgi:hypothetical protein